MHAAARTWKMLTRVVVGELMVASSSRGWHFGRMYSMRRTGSWRPASHGEATLSRSARVCSTQVACCSLQEPEHGGAGRLVLCAPQLRNAPWLLVIYLCATAGALHPGGWQAAQ